MRPVKYSMSFAMKLTPAQRRAIEGLADEKSITLGEAAREFLNAGMAAVRCIEE